MADSVRLVRTGTLAPGEHAVVVRATSAAGHQDQTLLVGVGPDGDILYVKPPVVVPPGAIQTDAAGFLAALRAAPDGADVHLLPGEVVENGLTGVDFGHADIRAKALTIWGPGATVKTLYSNAVVQAPKRFMGVRFEGFGGLELDQYGLPYAPGAPGNLSHAGCVRIARGALKNWRFWNCDFTNGANGFAINPLTSPQSIDEESDGLAFEYCRFWGLASDGVSIDKANNVTLDYNYFGPLFGRSTRCLLSDGSTEYGLGRSACEANPGAVWIDGTHSDALQFRIGTKIAGTDWSVDKFRARGNVIYSPELGKTNDHPVKTGWDAGLAVFPSGVFDGAIQSAEIERNVVMIDASNALVFRDTTTKGGHYKRNRLGPAGERGATPVIRANPLMTGCGNKFGPTIGAGIRGFTEACPL